ncbi:MAG TPA: hypothetical protein VFB38_18785 [Chthonomonadaceae bacterium]|nr:hypothetical protein [Chthonomonadaceae bacterium]
MARSIHRREEAQTDLYNHATYIAKDNLSAAECFLSAVSGRCDVPVVRLANDTCSFFEEKMAFNWPHSPIEDRKLEIFGHRAYELCVQWFGVPEDASWPYILLNGPRNACTRNRLLRASFL